MSGSVIWQKGGFLHKCDCMCISEGSVSCRCCICEETGMMMGGRVSELGVGLLDSKDVHVVGKSEIYCAGIRESFLLIPGANADVR